jgi:hypothetical protein
MLSTHTHTNTVSTAAMRAALTDGLRRTLGSAVSRRQQQQQQLQQQYNGSSNSVRSVKRRPQSAVASRTSAAQHRGAITTSVSTSASATATGDRGSSSSKQWASRTGPARLHNLVSMVAEVLILHVDKPLHYTCTYSYTITGAESYFAPCVL